MWLDCRDLLSHFPPPHKYANDPVHFFKEEAGIGLSDGRDFGASGHVRLNFGEYGKGLKGQPEVLFQYHILYIGKA